MKAVNPSFFHKLLSYPMAIILTPIGGVVTILYCIAALVGAFFLRTTKGFGDWIIWAWASAMCKIFRLKVEVEGTENLPDEGCLFILNHNSLFDIVVFHIAVRKSARFGAKIELFKIPFFGAAMTRLGALPIARGDVEKVKDVYQRSIPKVKEGKSYVLAAEGTRNIEGGVGKKFKSGPMIFAISGQFPIVPVVIIGTYEIISKNGFLVSWGRFQNPVKVKILPASKTQGLGMDDRHSLKTELRERMTNAFNAG